MATLAAGVAQTRTTLVTPFAEMVLFFPLHSVTANGTASVEQTVHLPRNAVVLSPWLAGVRAGRAQWTFANAVAQTRVADISKTGTGAQQRRSVVIDFGGLRTVSAVGLMDNSLTIIRVRAWNGAAFGDPPAAGVRSGTINESTAALAGIDGFIARFSSEVRTERLQVDVIGGGTVESIGEVLIVELPDAPADLELRINGGAPVWTAPGAVVKGAPGWTDDGELQRQDVDLSAALTALLGDPAADITPETELRITLSARVPGALELLLPPASAQQIRYIKAVALSPVDADLEFAAEGLEDVALPLPSWAAAVEEVRLRVTADLPPERTLPPVGPSPLLIGTTTTPIAELRLDPDHAAVFDIAAVPFASAFAELIGARAPMVVSRGGVELRMLLLARDRDSGGNDVPGAPLPGGSSTPIVLDAAPLDAETWATFVLPKAVKLDGGVLPYLCIVATRGEAQCAFTDSLSGSTIWRGPPSGPFTRLPSLGGLPPLRGRARVTGRAARQSPVAPLQLWVGSATSAVRELTPTPKGLELAITPAAPIAPDAAGTATLSIVSRVPGTVSLADVRLILSRLPSPA